jgi:hypothetical protein
MHVQRAKAPSVSIPLPGQDDAELVLRMGPSNTGLLRKFPLVLEVTVRRELKSDVSALFESLTRHVLPQDNPPVVKLPYHMGLNDIIDVDGNLPEGLAVPRSLMPRRFQTVADEIEDKLTGIMRGYFKTLRWVQCVPGQHNPLRFHAFEWSSDKSTWHDMPTRIEPWVEIVPGIDATEEAVNKVTAIWAAGASEPLGHELIREALHLASGSPRSALLMGVAALETGLKEYIEASIPNSDLLLDKSPSPPVVAIVQDIIPPLQKKMGLSAEGFPLSEEQKKYLTKWVTLRNQVTHGRKGTVRPDDLRGFLRFVRALLYRLDVCRGQEWASAFGRYVDPAGDQRRPH